MSSGQIEIVQGDITALDTDAIVNAANRRLQGGGGVDGAIHRAAGPELLAECVALGGCDTGAAKMTKGYRLSAHHVIHAVGPVWAGGEKNERALLAQTYRSALTLAADHGLTSVAFPNISTGVYGFPKRAAAEIAFETVVEYLGAETSIRKVVFVCFDAENYALYSELSKQHSQAVTK